MVVYLSGYMQFLPEPQKALNYYSYNVGLLDTL